MELKLIMALNGWIIEYQEDESEPVKRQVFSYADSFDDEEEVKAFAQLLWSLNDLIGPSTSRYSKARVYIEVKPGDKHEDLKDEDK